MNVIDKTVLDQVTLVDTNDQVIGQMDKTEAHRGEGRLHRASSVYLFRKNPHTQKIESLFQQRSIYKIVGANQWGNAVCGNVRPGESYEDCAIRRLREELGVSNPSISTEHQYQYRKFGGMEDVYDFMYQAKCNDEFSENEIDHVFVSWYDGVVEPNPQEAQDYLWIEWFDLLEKVKALSLTEYKPGGENIIVKSNRGEKTININPWTLIMLEKKELVQKIGDFLSE